MRSHSVAILVKRIEQYPPVVLFGFLFFFFKMFQWKLIFKNAHFFGNTF